MWRRPTRVVEKIVHVEKIVQIPVQYDEWRTVEVPYPVENIIEKIVEQPCPARAFP